MYDAVQSKGEHNIVNRKITGIESVTVNGVDSLNIETVDIWPVTEEMSEDLIDILFSPWIVEGIGAKQWAKCWLLKVVHDGWTDVWDTYIEYDAEAPVIPTLVVTLEILTEGVVGTEVWTFQASKSYVSNLDDIGMRIEEKYTPGAIWILINGTVAITHP
ncbi:unnamed protein product [marine sediment metagenome]|uniref:Uncharacterized protein n=1 Tax=marine sediment metagenome TaxID=412755 RepID=X0YXB4_9ZZZZ